MKISNLIQILALAAAFPALTQAGLTTINGYLGVETESIIDIEAFNIIETDFDAINIDRTLTTTTGFDTAATVNFDTAVQNNAQSARSINNTSFNTNANGFEFNTTLNSTATRGTGFQSFTSNSSSLDVLMIFDTDTVLNIFLRIDYQNIGNADLSAEFELNGLQSPALSFIEIENPQSDGFVELAFQATVLAGDTFTLSGGGFLSLYTFDQGDILNSGDLALTASVQIVPAPAGFILIGGFAALASRQRRRN